MDTLGSIDDIRWEVCLMDRAVFIFKNNLGLYWFLFCFPLWFFLKTCTPPPLISHCKTKTNHNVVTWYSQGLYTDSVFVFTSSSFWLFEMFAFTLITCTAVAAMFTFIFIFALLIEKMVYCQLISLNWMILSISLLSF